MKQKESDALRNILRGNAPDKEISISMHGTDKEEQDLLEQELAAELEVKKRFTEVMKKARVPMFCPECEKVMSKKLDDKMWDLYGHCFDCQMDFENKLRISGTYEEYAKKKVLLNKKAWLKEQLDSIVEWKENSKVEFLNQTAADTAVVDVEKWQHNQEHIDKISTEATETFAVELVKVEQELEEVNGTS